MVVKVKPPGNVPFTLNVSPNCLFVSFTIAESRLVSSTSDVKRSISPIFAPIFESFSVKVVSLSDPVFPLLLLASKSIK